MGRAPFYVSVTPLGLAWGLAIVYIATLSYARSIATRDPGSWFFDSTTAYEARHTKVRQKQAASYITTANTSTPSYGVGHQKSTKSPRMCVGILSAARESRYLDTTLGSLLDGLTSEERDDLHLIVLLPHSDPARHSAYHEPWLHSLTEDVLYYNTSMSDFDHIVDLEHERAPFRKKGLYDYKSLIEACLDRTDAPYIAIFEDDIVAASDWYRRTLAGVAQSELSFTQDNSNTGFLYLRLFYTEQFLGWNSEDGFAHASWSLLVIGASWLVMYWTYLWSPRAKRFFDAKLSLMALVLTPPLLVVLFFATGRVTLLPPSAGVSVMNRYGCCSQALVFPRAKARDLVSWFQEARIGFVDVLIEEYADRHPGEDRLALVPPVIQHVGRKSSKGDANEEAVEGMTVAQQIWNFQFETQGIL